MILLIQLLEIRDILKDINTALGIAQFRDAEVQFLVEYELVLWSLAAALNRLQSKKSENAFIGYVLSTILTVADRIKNLKNNLNCTLPLADAVLSDITVRFPDILGFESSATNNIVAAVSIPKFKLHWVPTKYQQVCHSLFINCMQSCKRVGHVLCLSRKCQ